jgi:DNA replication licensing factor MCM5
MTGVTIPGKCDRPVDLGSGVGDCGPNPYMIMADHCEYIDVQTLKLQEAPEVVPTGEMPRHILLYVDRYLVDRVAPGTRVSVIGVVATMNTNEKKGGGRVGVNGMSIKTPYLKVLGMQIDTDGSGGRTIHQFTSVEEDEFKRLSRDPQIYEKLAASIAPQISGDYTKDLKKAIACLLMSGSRKVLPDGVKLRGDINVLLMGDPSTAKSQFLKFVEKVAPIGVYTSGKGSSAAGLTASVIKDSKGEFYLEGGAMVLADGGVICIDEVSPFSFFMTASDMAFLLFQSVSFRSFRMFNLLSYLTSFLVSSIK